MPRRPQLFFFRCSGASPAFFYPWLELYACFGARASSRRAPGRDEGDESGEGRGAVRLRLRKSRGQHLLTNPRVLDSIVRKAQVRPTDTILEIGPGTGNLTVRLLASAAHVVAIEVDDRMVDALVDRVSGLGIQHRLTVIREDALKTQFPPFDLCVANIPYGISSPLIARLLLEQHRPCFRSATLLLQKEFAQRLLAVPGDSEFNRLAANIGLVATVKPLMDVSKKDFVPCPKVDSALVRIQPKPDIPMIDLDEWLAFTRTCFSKKNKTLGAIFKQKKNVIELFRRSQANSREEKITQENEKEVDDDMNDDDDDDDVDDDNGHTGESRKTEKCGLEVGLFKQRLVGLLQAEGFENKRPSKLPNEELLRLLKLFNQVGVVFHISTSRSSTS